MEVEAYLRRLVSLWKGSELVSLGRSVEGRPLWALVVEPQVKSDTKPLTVLMLGGIHSGECDGKEALLALAREMASGSTKVWQNLRLIFVPNFMQMQMNVAVHCIVPDRMDQAVEWACVKMPKAWT